MLSHRRPNYPLLTFAACQCALGGPRGALPSIPVPRQHPQFRQPGGRDPGFGLLSGVGASEVAREAIFYPTGDSSHPLYREHCRVPYLAVATRQHTESLTLVWII